MAQIGITITKQVLFRDATQEFNNTYHYGSVETEPSESEAQALIDEVADFEKSVHSTFVTFIRGRLWSSGGTTAQNEMIAEKALTGSGVSSGHSSMDRERAVLISWRAGVDVRGHPVYLRKWYHTCGNFGSTSITSTTILANMGGFNSTDRAAIANKADEITRIGAGLPEGWGLVAESGRERDGGLPIAHRYLEHHQLGDMWR